MKAKPTHAEPIPRLLSIDAERQNDFGFLIGCLSLNLYIFKVLLTLKVGRFSGRRHGRPSSTPVRTFLMTMTSS